MATSRTTNVKSFPYQSARSVFVAALALFALMNIVLTYVPCIRSCIRLSTAHFPYRTWSWWTIHDLEEQQLKPNVVLLGSSLMVTAISEADANYMNKRLDLSMYRKAMYLDEQMTKCIGGQYLTANLSAPGQMPSDAYMTFKALLESGKKPAIVIYGLAPRDFLDGTLSNAFDTESFKYLRRLIDIRDIADDVFLSPLDKLEWYLESNVYLYKCSLELKTLCVNYWCHSVDDFLNKKVMSPTFICSRRNRMQLLPLYKLFDLEPGMLMAELTDKTSAAQSRIDNMEDYRARYRNPDISICNSQLRCLRRIAGLCKKEHIELVLVNMPITRENVSLLPKQVFQRYLDDIKAIASSMGVPFLNLCQFEQYQYLDFRDSVHLNGLGGKKFIDSLVLAIAEDGNLRKTIVQALSRSHGSTIASTKLSKAQRGL